jgi:hypothetical protein
MEVNSSCGRIEKFNGKLSTISFKELKVTFSTVVCELELKYEALDVYEQNSSRILGVAKIPNPTYATAIANASQAPL